MTTTEPRYLPPLSRDDREATAAAVRALQEALAPNVSALVGTEAGMDVYEAFDRLGRAADALHYGVLGANGKALDEMRAAAELLRDAASRIGADGFPLPPIATSIDAVVSQVETWPITHASIAVRRTPDGWEVVTPTRATLFDSEEAALSDAVGRAEPTTGAAFTTFLAPEGFESGDGRMLELDSTSWRDPPLALMVQDTSSHGPGAPDAAWFAGAIETVYRDPADSSRILGRGHLVSGADGERAEALVRGGLRGVSIDGIGGMTHRPVEQITAVDEEGNPVSALVRYGDTRIMGATVVPHPAFEPCCIWFDDEPVPESVTMTHGSAIPVDAEPEVIPQNVSSLLASGGGPLRPPKAWFFADEPDEYRAISVREDGFISGHLARFGTCHIGYVGKCETAPRSSTGYRFFHRTLAETDGGNVACGWLTMNTPHQRNLRASAAETMNHYDHTGTLVAKIRVIDGKHGPWACGSIAPGLDERTIWALQGPDVSGDWRDVEGHPRELVAVLGVPLPGFLSSRPEALVASGQIVAQLGELPCDDCGGPSPLVAHLSADRSMAAEIADLRTELKMLRPVAVAHMKTQVSPVAELARARAIELAELEVQAARERLAAILAERDFAKYNAADLKKMIANGQAMKPDGSYPIADAEDLANAIRAVGRGGADHDKIRAHIIRRAKALGKADAIPKNWNPDGSMK